MTVEILADHPIWVAVPAFLPAFVVAGVVVYVAMRNRSKRDAAHSEDPGSNDQDG